MDKPYYQDEYVTIYHGDCRDILPVIGDVGIVITSPPYNVGKEYGEYSDTKDGDDYQRLISDVSILVYQSMKRGGRVFFNIPLVVNDHNSVRTFPAPVYCGALESAGFIFRDGMVWVKSSNVQSQDDIIGGNRTAWGSWLSPSNPFMRGCAELIIAYSKDTHKLDGEGIQMDASWFMKHTKNAWYIDSTHHNKHPAVFPVELPLSLMRLFSFKDTLALDPFLGTGTTAWAAKKLNRKCIGIEIEERYCEIAANRCRQMVMELNIG